MAAICLGLNVLRITPIFIHIVYASFTDGNMKLLETLLEDEITLNIPSCLGVKTVIFI